MGEPHPEIDYVTSITPADEVRDLLAPVVNTWIDNQFDSLNEVQRMAIPRIIDNKNTLVMAPTGAGKTLAAFLGIISELHLLEKNDELQDQIYALYISPLKALNNDIHKNLEIPLNDIKELTNSSITAAKRTGDTPTKERQRLLRNPPHILITTPESLGLMLAAPKFKQHLRNIKWLIIDEIHSIADNKRGSHLSLSLERLEFYLERPLTRIGLSATVEPAELVAHYLVGMRNVPLGIIDRGGLRQLDIRVITPTRNLVHAPFSLIEQQQLEYLRKYIDENRTILIFTNTRHLSERLVVELKDQVDDENKDRIAVHHGSLDKGVRLSVENRLKNGEMKAVFTSTSLEMGIDIGSIDLTVQLGSPKTVRALLQRIGRSGHSQDLVSKGRVLVFGRDDLLECIAIAKLAEEGRIDAIRIPEAPIDVLIQIIVGMAVEQKWSFREAYTVISKAYPYRKIGYDQFVHLLRTAADPTKNEDSWKYGHIWMDEEIQEFGRRKSARQAYLQNIGTIPDSTTIDVVLQGFRTTIGQIAEKFAERLKEQDIFVLGGKSYEFIRSIGNKILVDNAPGRVPTVPSWGGEAQSRTYEISKEIDRLMSEVEIRLETNRNEAVSWVVNAYPVEKQEAEAVVDYIIEQLGLAPLPRLDKIIVETYTDPAGSTNILILMLFGLESNQALAQALGTILSEELQNNIGILATDNGVLLRIPPGLETNHFTLFDRLQQIDLETYVRKSLRDTELFKVRFRHAAARALMILRKWGKRSISVSRQQRTARWLLRDLSDTMPVVQETYREILYDSYNLKMAKHVIDQLRTGDITVVPLEPSEVPSSFTHDILLNGELDVVMMEDRRNLLASLHQQVISRILPELAEYSSILDPQEVDQYFSGKLSQEIELSLRLKRWAEFPYPDNQLELAEKWWNIDIEELQSHISKHDNIIRLSDGQFTTENQLPFIASTRGEEFWTKNDFSDPHYTQAKAHTNEISPDIGWEHLILKSLEFGGPHTISDLTNRLQTTKDRLEAIVKKLQRRNIILKGNFTSDQDQYMKVEDREQLTRASKIDQQITEDQLKNYRLFKMRLVKSNRSDQISILDYLRENGPARDPIELVARIEDFNWNKLRSSLSNRDVYFGRFLGRRLVFIHHQDLEMFVQITRDHDSTLTDVSKQVLEVLSERPGLTQRELSNILTLPSSSITDAINQLEEQLYVSRTGFELTLTHGGFPNPRYIALPHIETDKSTYQYAVKTVLERCCHWYGPLTLNDLLRITRLPYPIVEHGLSQANLETRTILNSTYYGHDYSFEMLECLTVTPNQLDEVYLLSPLDPYFYMTSGSFRRDFLPRQTQLSIIHEGMPKGHIEISIPDKDILQVINLQINKRRMRDFNFVKEIGIQLRDLGKLAYQTPVIFIEEIRYKAANHADNQIVVTTLEEIGYQLHIDHLVAGTSQRQTFSNQDIFATRQINRELLHEQSYTDFENMIESHKELKLETAIEMIQASPKKSKLLISHHLRKGTIHERNGKIYQNKLYRVLYGREKNPDDSIFTALQTIKTRSELAKQLEMDSSDVANRLYSLIQDGYVEIVSPFAQSNEYRQVPRRDFSLGKQIQILTYHYIQTQGPLGFSKLLELISRTTEVSRTQLLIILTTLLKSKKISSAAIDHEKNRDVIYFTPNQADILGDPTKSRYFEGWTTYETSEKIFDIDTGDSHVLVYEGKLVGTFSYERDTDRGIITDLNLVDPITVRPLLSELINHLEEFVFEKGLKRVELVKLGGAIPQYWMDLTK